MPFTSRDVTVYVPAYNADATLGACLDSVLAQTARPARILVVDDASSNPVRVPAGIEVIRHKENLGLACARNTALGDCRTALIASLDSDVVLEPRWLENLLAVMNGGELAGAGGRMVERYQDELADRWRAVHMAQNWGEAAVINPRFLFGANTIFRSDLLREAGGYDERHRTNNEDRVVSDALYRKGYNLAYVPAAKCEHLRRDTCKSVLNGYWQWHHAKGLLDGDYQTPEGLIDRVARVNFGIFRYRYDLDAKAGREEFLPLDAAIPWVFGSRDLSLFARLKKCACPGLLENCGQELPEGVRKMLKGLH
jgi:Glycosyltransferases, probably involved in cell wall biogenesis